MELEEVEETEENPKHWKVNDSCRVFDFLLHSVSDLSDFIVKSFRYQDPNVTVLRGQRLECRTPDHEVLGLNPIKELCILNYLCVVISMGT